ncbi:UNVERIFIED_CONTAM: hypothetical protein Scaly_0859400 [Sesamum calycinum]|uniref:Retrotransposon Copia-like N-terminal domain-containing protein n=1 Tax=Sesamum calycinum TaxID=2727403 RepID=A0AAW2QVP5_9LAMI
MTETSSTGENRMTMPEKLQLHGSDHPGMVLVSAPLTGKNYLNWSFGVKRALRAKMKLSFIDGTSIKPNANHPHFEQWIRVDSMVTTWILNSISKDIVEAFMYTKSSRNLWLDLEQQYGECNGPQLYQLQRKICSMTQGHNKETCFKIHGTPDWYKELQDKRRRDTIPARGFTVDANPMKEVHSETKGELLQELIRLIKTGFQMDSPQGNFAQSDDFAGYSQSQKTYKVYNLDSNTLSTSRDVVFHEHTFSFQAVSVDSDPVSIPLPIVDSDVHTSSQDAPIPFSNSLHPFPVTQRAVPTSSDTHIPLRRSQRTTSKPSWLNDY